MVAATKKDAKATDGPTFRQRVDDTWTRLLGALRKDTKGWVHLAVAAVVTLVLSAALYWPLGLPGRILTRILTKAVDGSCVTNTTGITNWFCGMGVSLVAMSGAILVIIALILLRGQVRKAGSSAVKQGPAEFHFLEKPVVITLAFAMAWSSVLFHFYGRMGLIIDGLFPAFVGILMFSLDHWDGPIKKGLGPVWRIRDRIPKLARLALVIAVPTLLGFLMTGWMPFSIRDQLAALFAVFIGWIMWTSAPEPSNDAPPRHARATGAALVVLVALAALLLIAAPVSAQGPCADIDLYFSFVLCETAHHSGTFGAASSWVGIGATAVVLAPTKPEETAVVAPDKKPEKVDVDPCADLQSSYDQSHAQWMLTNNLIQDLERFLQGREAEYRARNESLFVSQLADLFMQGLSVGGAIRAGPGPATALGRMGDAVKGTLTGFFAQEAIKQSTGLGGDTTAKDLPGVVDKATADNLNKQLGAFFQDRLKEQAARDLVASGTRLKPGSPVFEGVVNNMTTEAMEKFQAFTAAVSGVKGLWDMFGKYSDLKSFSDKIHQGRLRLIDMQGDNDLLYDRLMPMKYDLDNCRERVAMGLNP